METFKGVGKIILMFFIASLLVTAGVNMAGRISPIWGGGAFLVIGLSFCIWRFWKAT